MIISIIGSLYYFVYQFCWIFLWFRLFFFQSCTCPKSFPKPNHIPATSLDKVVQQLSLVEMLRGTVDGSEIRLNSWDDHCFCLINMHKFADVFGCWPQVSPNLGDMEFVPVERQFINFASNKDNFFFWKCRKHWEIIKKSNILSRGPKFVCHRPQYQRSAGPVRASTRVFVWGVQRLEYTPVI